MAKERYENLGGIRAFAAIGVILMHVWANGNFGISGFVYDDVIASFTNLTYFFMLLSAFSMCCGYYEKFHNNTINVEQFYKKRYARIWPFFTVLCTIELLLDHSLQSLYEWFADLTLAFGLLPNANISVVGVGWFIGTIFLFYMIFPFFVFLIGNKKRAWLVMGLTFVFHVLCQIYFFDENHVIAGFRYKANIVYSSIFFVAGGLIYLYRNQIIPVAKKYKNILCILSGCCLVFYYTISSSILTMIILFSLFTILGMSGGNIANSIFQNKPIQFLGSISMEIYLCHMFIYRLIERIGLLHFFRSEEVNYVLVSAITICGAAIMSVVLNLVIEIAKKKVGRR